jgi:hypothetical protein
MKADGFERQLAIFVVVIIINVVAPVMHGQEIDDANVAISLLMFNVMRNKGLQLKQLIYS